MQTSLTIGQLAQQAGVGIETIRYYQKRSLLPQGQSGQGVVRRYEAALVQRILFIKRAQKLGFTLDEIAALLQLDDLVDRAAIRQLAQARLQNIQQKVADLQRMEQVLLHLVTACADAKDHSACPIIATLSGQNAPLEG